MKKFLIVFVVLLLAGVGVFMFLRARGGSGSVDEEANLPEIPLEQRPFTTLTPKDDGHWLKLNIAEVKVSGAQKLDYELLYKTKDGVTQGVPGSVMLANGGKIERDLLLGSESSGKFRYDDGVDGGSLTLRFRNDKGKLIGKLTTEFALQKGGNEIASKDGKFKYAFDKPSDKDFFVAMKTFGLPKEISSFSDGPYGVFASKVAEFPGVVTFTAKVFRFDGSDWKELSENKSSNIGTFIAIGQ